MSSVAHVSVRGFKSIASLNELGLNSLNVMIGANGVGKSNLLELFSMLAHLMDGKLKRYVINHGGPDQLLHRSRNHTPEMEIAFEMGDRAYRATLIPDRYRLVFAEESLGSAVIEAVCGLGSGHDESNLIKATKYDQFADAELIKRVVSQWRVYHFLDTSRMSAIRQAHFKRDNLGLKSDGSNLASYLRYLNDRYPDHHARIVQSIRLVTPCFGDFVYRDDAGDQIDLEWQDVTDPETVKGPAQLSDGTLRFMCLATLLEQPVQLQPHTILIDEPELGLHPYALAIFAELLENASKSRQIVVATQSASLVNHLEPESVLVAERKSGESVFNRLDCDELRGWLEDFSLGDLWQMNVFGGRP